MWQLCLLPNREKWAFLIENLPWMLTTKLQFIWPSGFRGKYFFYKSTNQKQELPVVAIFINGPGQIEQSLQRTFHGCFLLSHGSFGQAISEDIYFFYKSVNQKQELPVGAMLINESDQNVLSLQTTVHRCVIPSFSSFGQGFQRRRLKCGKLTDDRRRSPSNGKSSLCLSEGELKRTKRQTTIYKTLHRGGAHEG